ncbi:hypothetical protein ADK67_46420 [Saccharothrix sp. NRRL B-16348]|uniref:hypothetical protein n=1 Tax=Saccharothrix sp. NRRL B-16348 TaxID=1415542 RepID=UPI0006ADA90F|nr:hypothetical protein [Saccharothrix sp. NRRL B-16348]KOX12953.1 hypothetical protein ADK67_46420 [Saccharothrix sp. NRRL B-16348]
MTTTTYENAVRIGSTTYQVVATADPDLSVDLAGVDGSGVLVAEGTIRLPADAGAKIGKLLAQVLEALGRLSTPSTLAARDRPANANQPWTQALDDGLRADWLAATTDTPTADLIRSIAKRLERSPTSIRSRLAKVGCDPDVPGRTLSDEGAQVFRVQGRDQGRVRGKPDSGGEGVE